MDKAVAVFSITFWWTRVQISLQADFIKNHDLIQTELIQSLMKIIGRGLMQLLQDSSVKVTCTRRYSLWAGSLFT